MKTKETVGVGDHVLELMARLRNDKCQPSMSERTLLADVLEAHLKSGAELLLSLEIARRAADNRTATRAALMAVIQHLRSCGVSAKLWKPLHALWCGLADMDRGISNDLVDRLPYKRGTQKTIQETLDWAVPAAKVTRLTEGKTPAAVALKTAAKAHGLDSNKLREFRKNIQRGHASPRAQKYYNWFLQDRADPKGAKQRHRQRELADVTEDDVKFLVSVWADIAKRERG
jgi:hypothetical protein